MATLPLARLCPPNEFAERASAVVKPLCFGERHVGQGDDPSGADREEGFGESGFGEALLWDSG